MILIWLILGWSLSYHKAQLGKSVGWIGYKLEIGENHVIAKIKEEFMKEFHDLTVELLAKPKLTLDALRSYAGKANHVAALIYQWRPFLDQIWAALSIKKVGTTAPVGAVWTKQVSYSLNWHLTFLRGSPGELVRSWRVDFFSHRGVEVIMILDASPFALGGILIEDGCVVSWFASELSNHDETIHKQQRGQAEGQQTWEALCVLVAVRCWASRWMDKRVSINMKSDNMAALSLAARLKSKVSSLIAKETALVYSSASFQPRYVEHVPGVLNFSADALSRLSDPNGDSWMGGMGART